MVQRALGLACLAVWVCCGAFAQGPTYSKEVSRIFQAKCQICHRDGDIAPFALNSYDDAAAWAPDIQRVITTASCRPGSPSPATVSSATPTP